MSEKQPIEPLMAFDIEAYLKDQFTRAIIQQMRAEPGMEWFSPGTLPPDEIPEAPK